MKLYIWPVYMMKTKVAFLEGRLFFNQSGLFENFSDCSWQACLATLK